MNQDRLTATQWAVIGTIRQEPEYRFVSHEKRSAEAMVRRGLLAPRGDNKYRVTAKGMEAYRRISMTPDRPNASNPGAQNATFQGDPMTKPFVFIKSATAPTVGPRRGAQ